MEKKKKTGSLEIGKEQIKPRCIVEFVVLLGGAVVLQMIRSRLKFHHTAYTKKCLVGGGGAGFPNWRPMGHSPS